MGQTISVINHFIMEATVVKGGGERSEPHLPGIQTQERPVSGVTFILIFPREYLSCITLCWSQADIMSGYFLS